MVPIKEALTFDDVTLVPKYSEILPSEVDTSIKLTNYLKLNIPLLSSAMDTVTESKMAIAIAKAGGIGIIHRNLDIKKQILEIKKVKKLKLLVGAAVGAGPSEFKRAEAILKEKINMIVVDTAHGHTKKVSEIIKFIKKTKDKKTALCAGNIATPSAAKFLLKLGVDVIKVGIGPGSICTTRLVAGIGVPQLSAILEVRNGIKMKAKILKMKKIAILLIILFASCEAPSSGVSEADANTFEKNVATLKNDFIKGYEEGDYDKVVSIFADSIQWYGPGVNAEMVKGIDILKENVTFWMENFENISFTEGGGLPGTDVGFWGGNTYPVAQAMSGPNNVRMYGTWNITNSSTGKSVEFKHYLVWNFNEDGKVHTVTEYADVGGVLSTFDE